MAAKKRPYKKIALALSLCMLILWGIMGTGASLAWFADTAPELKNVINVADFKLNVYHRLDNGGYELVDSQTQLFDEEALYEPGYTQVIYLKVENAGDIPFNYQTAVVIWESIPGQNVFEETFLLQDHLKFGLVTANTQTALEEKIATRQLAQAAATQPLGEYNTDPAVLDAGQTTYMALVVYMPEEVGNDANYRGTTVPTVKLGISVTATQIH